jgi:hypothetical protein
LPRRRIEAIDKDRTLALIDRTLTAERQASTGTSQEKNNKTRFLADTTGSRAEAAPTSRGPFLLARLHRRGR